MAAPVIQFKRGLLANLPGLQAGEPGFTTDSYDFYIGLTSETSTNKFFGSHRYWTKETSSTGSGINLVEGTSNGDSFITLASPASLVGIVSYYLPGSITDGGFLKTNSSGELSWSTEIANPTFQNVNATNTSLAGVTTISGVLDNNANSDFSGITTFSNLEDNTLGNADTGSVQIDGGLGVNKNVTVGGNFWVEGSSNFVGVVTFQGGTINLGDSTGDNINVGGEFTSGLFPNTTATYDLGDASRQWRNASLSGILTASDGAVIDNVKIGVDGSTTINTSSGDLILDSATDYVQVSAGLTVTQSAVIQGSLQVDGNTTLGNNSSDVLTINATTNFTGPLTGTASTATRSTTVDTTATSTNADYYVPFVDTLEGENGETIRVGAGLSVNPSSGEVKTKGILSVGNPAALTSYIKAGGGSNAMYLYENGDVSFQSKIIASQIRSNDNSSTLITLSGLDATFAQNITVTGITTTGTFKLSGTPGIAITGISTSGTLAENSDSYFATQKAIKTYVDAQVTASNLSFGGDTGTGSVDLDSQTFSIAGTASEIETSASGQTITIGLPNDVIVGTSLSAPTIKTATIQHSNSTQAATIDTSGNIVASQNLTVTGNLYVNGSTTQVNTASITVEDRTIELGQVDGAAPSTATTWDLGVLFNYNSSGAKKSGVIWEHSVGRFRFGSQVIAGDGTDNDTPQITISNYAPIEIGSLWVNDCAGQSQVITCVGTERFLQNITIDAGTF